MRNYNYFTKSEIDAFLAEAQPKYPSLDFKAKQAITSKDRWHLLIYSGEYCVSIVDNADAWGAFIAACRCMVADEDLKATKLVTKPDLGKDQYIINYILTQEKTPAPKW